MSDEEDQVSSGEEEIPFRGKPEDHEDNDIEAGDEDEEGEEDEYVVEKIVGHKIVKVRD